MWSPQMTDICNLYAEERWNIAIVSGIGYSKAIAKSGYFNEE